MDKKISREWLKDMAEKEDGKCISVGDQRRAARPETAWVWFENYSTGVGAGERVPVFS